jgi:hypothetical protein
LKDKLQSLFHDMRLQLDDKPEDTGAVSN